MYKDEIPEKIYKYREDYAKSFNYDLQAIFEFIRKKQAASGRKMISFPLKPSRKKAKNLLR